MSEKEFQKKLEISKLIREAFGNQKPDNMNYGEIKEIIEKYRDITKETMNEREKILLHSILVSNQAKLDEYIKYTFK